VVKKDLVEQHKYVITNAEKMSLEIVIIQEK
jgi:hypothetical protein